MEAGVLAHQQLIYSSSLCARPSLRFFNSLLFTLHHLESVFSLVFKLIRFGSIKNVAIYQSYVVMRP